MPIFTRFADAVAEALARPGTFVIAIALLATWAISGPLFSFSDTWLLAINTGTTLSTFLMVFLLQHTQARDNAAIQAKLDELIQRFGCLRQATCSGREAQLSRFP